ncbi:hypothetical protein CAEBREN_09414 [Caenorhabditis brenneri]|uniref:Uncharacterized protein n=1 Tax=Caenorhabditis brenneri TaxID=135651 RepID=G0NNM8_CAEBE|nr:hypothetical protein CAEBREN_09414 [Caenorhabditis brenneri]
MSKLNCDAGIFRQSFKFALENSGFVIGNYHEETVAGIPMLLSNSESLVTSLIYDITHSIPSLPDTSQIEKIHCNWSSREVDFPAFDFDDHQDLLELYGLSEQDVQVNDDEFCDSPTWPGKP